MKNLRIETTVVFRKFKDGGDIVALFPNEVADFQGNCLSYQHIGQHGAADYNHCIAVSRPATPAEYRALQRELEGIGYCLLVRARRSK